VRVGFEEDPEDVLLAGVAARLGPRLVASDRELAPTRACAEADFADRELAPTRGAVEGSCAGADETLAVPVDLQLVRSDFRRAALVALHDEVHPGQVVTYGGLRAVYRRARVAPGH